MTGSERDRRDSRALEPELILILKLKPLLKPEMASANMTQR
jgi:hypothetical protein